MEVLPEVFYMGSILADYTDGPRFFERRVSHRVDQIASTPELVERARKYREANRIRRPEVAR